MSSVAPKPTSRLFGQLAAKRHCRFGIDCATAGAATAALRAAFLRNVLRCMAVLSTSKSLVQRPLRLHKSDSCGVSLLRTAQYAAETHPALTVEAHELRL